MNKAKYRSAATAVLAAIVFCPAFGAFAQTEERLFNGFYVGLDAGRQNIIGRALVNGVDTLQQSSRSVATLLGGARLQLGYGIVAGLEGGIGLADGKLSLSDPANGLTVEYKNSTQVQYGVVLGYALGAQRDTLIFGYLSQVERRFDVSVQSPQGNFEQRDAQGLLRFGAGVERKISGPFRLRATIGTSRADFRGRPTNINVKTALDLAVSAIYQF